MINKHFLILFSAIISLNISCTKNPEQNLPANPVNPSNPVTVSNSQDSILVLSSLRGTSARFSSAFYGYDSTSNSITQLIGSSFSYESTSISYNPNNSIAYLIHKEPSPTSPYQITPSIFKYNSKQQLIKIFHKFARESGDYTQQYITDTSSNIASYDSLNYNDKGQVTSLYTGTQQYLKFTYYANNDSLLQKVERYNRVNNDFVVSAYINFLEYDHNPNPFYHYFKLLAFTDLNAYVDLLDTPTILQQFFVMNVNNCTKVSCDNSTLNPILYYYTYNADGLPAKCTESAYSGPGYLGETISYNYTKVKKQ